MEDEEEAKGRRFRLDTSPTDHPDTAKLACNVKPRGGINNRVVKVKPTFKKVQIVYYLSRNDHLEHPHFMEVTHLAHHHLRLKDVLDRLTVLRGKGMASLYSWSCKRSYKNGYVWNDLTENDIMLPSEGAEYVLKGSEIIQGCNEKFQQQLQVSDGSEVVVADPTMDSKRRAVATKRHSQPEMGSFNNKYEDEEEKDEEEDNTMRRSMRPQQLRCSRGVSTDELNQDESTHNHTNNNKVTELTLDNSSPPSTTSSTPSDKAINESNNINYKRFELDGESPGVGRNSVLLQLISCGSTSFRSSSKAAAAAAAVASQQQQPPPCAVARKSGASDLRKGVVCKAAVAAATATTEEEEEMMISCMSENPRFGNLQAEEKEYFSGSIVESMAMEERIDADAEPAAGFKRSSSYKEERSTKAELCQAAEEELKREKVATRGKCIPRMKKSSSNQPKK